MILSSLYPRFRDLSIIWAVLSTALFYGTPVIYTLDHASLTLRHVVSLNPLATLLEEARRWVIDPHAPSPAVLAGGLHRLLIPAAIYIGTCAVAVWVFNRESVRIAEEL